MTINQKHMLTKRDDSRCISDREHVAATKNQPPRAKTHRKNPKKITRTYLHNSGLYYLQRYAASVQRFRDVMRRKIYKSCQTHNTQDIQQCYDVLEDVISNFQKSDLLNDAIYAEGRVKALRRQGKSRQSIVTALMTKGVSSALIHSTLEQIDHNDNGCDARAEMSAAILFAKKKRLGIHRIVALNQDIEPFEQKKKDLARMARAGFSYDVSNQAISLVSIDTP